MGAARVGLAVLVRSRFSGGNKHYDEDDEVYGRDQDKERKPTGLAKIMPATNMQADAKGYREDSNGRVGYKKKGGEYSGAIVCGAIYDEI